MHLRQPSSRLAGIPVLLLVLLLFVTNPAIANPVLNPRQDTGVLAVPLDPEQAIEPTPPTPPTPVQVVESAVPTEAAEENPSAVEDVAGVAFAQLNNCVIAKFQVRITVSYPLSCLPIATLCRQRRALSFPLVLPEPVHPQSLPCTAQEITLARCRLSVSCDNSEAQPN